MTGSSVGFLIKNASGISEGRSTRVLHVDDDSCFLKTAKAILEMRGPFQVDTAASVEEAWKKMKKEEYDVIVSDYQMSGKDGLQFLKELRQRNSNIPFIVFTGKGREEVAIKALNLGADYYENKNGSPETVYGELGHAIRTSVERKRAAEEKLKAEKALKESEEKFRTLANSLPEIVFEADERGKLTFVNESVYAITGYPREDFAKGLNALDFPVPKHRGRAQENMKKVLNGEKTGTSEYRFQRKDGSTFPVLISSKPIVHEGKIVGLRGLIVDISERALMEEELQRFSSAVKMSSEGVVVTDLNGRIIETNDSASRFYRANAKSELVGKNVLELVDPQERSLVLERIEEATKKGLTLPHEYRLRMPPGRMHFIELTTTAMKDKEGKTYGLVSIIRDITERKNVEEALEQRNHSLATLNAVSIELASLPFDVDIREFLVKRLREITGATAVAFADYDAGNKTLVARLAEVEPGMQEKFTRLLGKSLEGIRCPISEKDYLEITKSVIGERRSLDEATYGGIPLSVGAEVQKLLDVDHFIGIAYIIEGELYGTSLLAIKVGMPDPPREMLETFAHLAAVALRRRCVEARALESEERYRELAESISDVFFAFDEDLRYTYWNRASEKLTGIKAKDAIGKSLTEVFPKVKGTEIEQVYQNVVKMKKHQTFFTEYQLRGESSIFELNAYPTQKGLSVFAKDVTERKRAEEKLRVLNEKLRVVGKLTRHDVKNKLSVVVNNIYLAKKTLPNNHKSLAYLKEIESACRETTKVLDFAAAYENLGSERLTLMEVDKAVEEAVSLLTELKGVKVVNNCQGLAVMADSALRQLFFNLIENSLKHGKNVSQIKIHYEKGKDRLKLICEDNGVGVPKANKPKLFNEGFTTGNGSGCGLPLIKSMMEIYGWTIEEEGEPGKGAKFVITIPKTKITMRARNTCL